MLKICFWTTFWPWRNKIITSDSFNYQRMTNLLNALEGRGNHFKRRSYILSRHISYTIITYIAIYKIFNFLYIYERNYENYEIWYILEINSTIQKRYKRISGKGGGRFLIWRWSSNSPAFLFLLIRFDERSRRKPRKISPPRFEIIKKAHSSLWPRGRETTAYIDARPS